MSRRQITPSEYGAIIAGLRALQDRIDSGTAAVLDGIRTADGEYPRLDNEGIDDLAEALQFGEAQLK